jgi:DNA-binding MarR family transcriptional regulator
MVWRSSYGRRLAVYRKNLIFAPSEFEIFPLENTMKVKEANKELFLEAMMKLVRAIKSESERCGETCGGFNEKELYIIIYIGRHQTVKMSDIAEDMASPMSTLTTIVDKLVDRKILSRYHSEEDRRVINVTLSKEGTEVYKLWHKQKKIMADKVLSKFKDSEQGQFIDHIHALAGSILQ